MKVCTRVPLLTWENDKWGLVFESLLLICVRAIPYQLHPVTSNYVTVERSEPVCYGHAPIRMTARTAWT